MAKFTIGIPTYNRAGFVRHAIESALDQSWPDVEVLVSDNASTDGTAEVVRSFGDRVRYHRNPENIGNWPNFARLTELACGDYFIWLQDDDLVHRDFTRRAVEGMESGDNVGVYAAFDVNGPSATSFNRPMLYGPPIALNWMRSELRVIDGNIVAPLSFFVSFANPPAIAFRTSVIRKAVQCFDPECELLNERIVLTRAAAQAKVAVDPWPAAIFLSHEQQLSRSASSRDALIRQWLLMADQIGNHLSTLEPEAWKPLLEQCFAEISIPDRLEWIHHIVPYLPVSEEVWGGAHPLAREVRSMLLHSLPELVQEEELARVEMEREAARARSDPSWINRAARQLAPPLAWDALRSIRRVLRDRFPEGFGRKGMKSARPRGETA
jgi:Glycosyl transferase family 2